MISIGRRRDILGTDSDGGRGVSNQVGQNPSLDYFTSRQMAALLGVSLRTLVNLRRRQALPYIRMGRLIRYRRDAVESAIKAYSIKSHFEAGETPALTEYIHPMRRRSKNWPRQYTRRYRPTKIRPTVIVKYGVDLGKQGGKKRDRRLFDTKKERDDFIIQARKACEEQGQIPFFLPPDIQSQANRLYIYLRDYNLMFEDVRHHYKEDVIPFLSVPNVPEIVTDLMARVERRYRHRRRTKWPAKLGGFLKEFSRRFSGKITDIKEDELESFCFRGDAAVTERDRRSMAAQLFNHAIKKSWAKVNLANSLDIPVLPTKEPGYLTIEEVRRLLAVADQFGLLGYFLVGLFLGVRPEEMFSEKKKPQDVLQWSDFYLEDKLVVVSAAASKIGRRRELPINDTLAAWLPLCIKTTGPVVDPVNFHVRFEACRAAAGLLDNWVQDVVRHTFATYHAAAYKDLPTTADLMGHIGGIRILKKHYVAFVSSRTAMEFWALRRPESGAVQTPTPIVTEVAPKAA